MKVIKNAEKHARLGIGKEIRFAAGLSRFSDAGYSHEGGSQMIGAVVQAGSVLFDRAACVEKAERLIHDAAAGGAQLIVFPEAFVGGYPRGVDFGASIGGRTDYGREMFRRYWESAVEIPGADMERLCIAAERASTEVVIGVIERDGGTLYCTVVFIGGDGTLRGKHRKLMPTASERLLWGFGDGSTMPVFETPLGRLGAVICWENYMPLLRYWMYSQNIQLYCAPTADNREGWISSMRHVAMEGRCFVLSCNQFTRRENYPEDIKMLREGAPTEVMSAGGSCIVAPSGDLIARPNWDGETILYADVDLHEIPRWKYDFDCVGHYARPDIFSLSANTTRTHIVDINSRVKQHDKEVDTEESANFPQNDI